MNERIYTLAEQTGATRWNDEFNGNSIDFSPEQFEKFTELIVQECIDRGNDLAKHYIDKHSEQEQVFFLLAAIADYSNEIKKHFGVTHG